MESSFIKVSYYIVNKKNDQYTPGEVEGLQQYPCGCQLALTNPM